MRIGIAYDLQEDYQLADNSSSYRYDFSTLEEISLLKATMLNLGHDVVLLKGLDYIAKNIKKIKRDVDIVFNRLEGYCNRNREGMLQTLLDIYNIKYVGSDAYACSLTMNKSHTKILAKHFGIPTPEFIILHNLSEIGKLRNFQYYPSVLKPNCEGSSDGVEFCKNSNIAIERATYLLQKFEQPILCEKYIAGREISVSVICNAENKRLMGIIETLDENGNSPNIYDLNQKFFGNMQKVIPDFTENEVETLSEYCLKLYDEFGLVDYARFDFRYGLDKQFYFLEINAIPALDSDGSFYNCAVKQNISFDKIVKEIISATEERYAKK